MERFCYDLMLLIWFGSDLVHTKPAIAVCNAWSDRGHLLIHNLLEAIRRGFRGILGAIEIKDRDLLNHKSQKSRTPQLECGSSTSFRAFVKYIRWNPIFYPLLIYFCLVLVC